MREDNVGKEANKGFEDEICVYMVQIPMGGYDGSLSMSENEYVNE